MYKLLQATVLTLLTLAASTSLAGDVDTIDAAIGGGVGGAVGGAVGAEIGDRKGAIVGAAVGAALGAAVATDDGNATHEHHKDPAVHVVVTDHVTAAGHPKGRHCPPGQAKKGRC